MQSQAFVLKLGLQLPLGQRADLGEVGLPDIRKEMDAIGVEPKEREMGRRDLPQDRFLFCWPQDVERARWSEGGRDHRQVPACGIATRGLQTLKQ